MSSIQRRSRFRRASETNKRPMWLPVRLAFLVVWQTSDMTIHGSVVTDAGAVSAKDFAIDHGTAGAGLPSAAFQGTDFAVGWTDARDGGALYGTRVSLAGTRDSADSKLAADAPRAVGFGSDHTNLVSNGSHLFFTYLGGEPNGVEGSLLTPTLAVAQGAIPLTAIPNSQGYPYTSFDGTNYVVAVERRGLFEARHRPSCRAHQQCGAGARSARSRRFAHGQAFVQLLARVSSQRNDALHLVGHGQHAPAAQHGG